MPKYYGVARLSEPQLKRLLNKKTQHNTHQTGQGIYVESKRKFNEKKKHVKIKLRLHHRERARSYKNVPRIIYVRIYCIYICVRDGEIFARVCTFLVFCFFFLILVKFYTKKKRTHLWTRVHVRL